MTHKSWTITMKFSVFWRLMHWVKIVLTIFGNNLKSCCFSFLCRCVVLWVFCLILGAKLDPKCSKMESGGSQMAPTCPKNWYKMEPGMLWAASGVPVGSRKASRGAPGSQNFYNCYWLLLILGAILNPAELQSGPKIYHFGIKYKKNEKKVGPGGGSRKAWNFDRNVSGKWKVLGCRSLQIHWLPWSRNDFGYFWKRSNNRRKLMLK